jgi:hypothetical protein
MEERLPLSPESIDELNDSENSDDLEVAARSRSVVRPIRDVPDELVFRFEVGPAILAQLLEKLQLIERTPLSNALSARYPGFYQLFVDGSPKYIGKTARPIGQRLREHAKKLRHRIGIDLGHVECKFAFVEDPSLVDVAEGALIDFFGHRGQAEWNASGFGSKVTGHRRGQQEASDWAQLYPPNLDAAIRIDECPAITLEGLLRSVALSSPITLSIPQRLRPRFREVHADTFSLPTTEKTFREWMDFVANRLASGWRLNPQAESWYVELDS